MNNKNFGLLMALLASFWLQGCSWLNFFGEVEEPPVKISSLRFETRWFHPELPAESLGLPESSKTLVGECEFQPELLKLRSDQHRGLLLPLIAFGEQGQVTLDPIASKPVYKALQSKWSLGSPYDSLQLYQRWVSSVEHSCPDGLRRELPHCVMKPFYSLGGLLGSDSSYELERINNWLTQHAPLDYLILPDLALLRSDSVLQLSYSPNSPVIIEQRAEGNYQQLQPFMLRKSLDWVLLDKDNRLISDEFISYGHCSVSWNGLDEQRRSGNGQSLDFDHLSQISTVINKRMHDLLKNISL